MSYFQDAKNGYTHSSSRERYEMEEEGFDPDCIEDRLLWRQCKACGECSTCNEKGKDQ